MLSVGALAHTGTYPPNSPLAAVQPPWPGPYPAPFTPTGPGVDLIAPGAAVITTALGDGYTAVDGTAIAAAHVTGLAALLLAHHDQLRTQIMPRTATRADQLYRLLRTACCPLPGADSRTGAGSPTHPQPWASPPAGRPPHAQLPGMPGPVPDTTVYCRKRPDIITAPPAPSPVAATSTRKTPGTDTPAAPNAAREP